MSEMAPARTYSQIVGSQFRKNKLAVISLHIIYILLFVFIFADFLANDNVPANQEPPHYSVGEDGDVDALYLSQVEQVWS